MENNTMCSNCHQVLAHYPLVKKTLCKKCWNLSRYCQKCNLHFYFKKTFSPDELCDDCTKNINHCYAGGCVNPRQFPQQYPVQCFECAASPLTRKMWNMCSNCGAKDFEKVLKPASNLLFPFWPKTIPCKYLFVCTDCEEKLSAKPHLDFHEEKKIHKYLDPFDHGLEPPIALNNNDQKDDLVQGTIYSNSSSTSSNHYNPLPTADNNIKERCVGFGSDDNKQNQEDPTNYLSLMFKYFSL